MNAFIIYCFLGSAGFIVIGLWALVISLIISIFSWIYRSVKKSISLRQEHNDLLREIINRMPKG